MRYLSRMTAALLACLALAACGEKDPRANMTPEQRIGADFADLAWTLMKPLDSSTECPKIGAALDAWEKENGARFRELAGQITKLEGAASKNFQRVKQRFDQVATYCVNPKTSGGIKLPQMTHDANVERVYRMLPATQLKFELK